MAKTLMQVFDEERLQQLEELLVIRDRRIELLVKEIDILKQIIASQKPVEVEPSWFTLEAAVGDETDEFDYPKYDELTKV